MNWYKIAQAQSPIGNTLGPTQLQALINNVVLQMNGMPRNPSYLAGRQQIETALQAALAQQGAGLQNSKGAVDQIMRALGYQMPATKTQPVPTKPQGFEDPAFEKFRQQQTMPPPVEPTDQRIQQPQTNVPVGQPPVPPAAPRQMPRKRFEAPPMPRKQFE